MGFAPGATRFKDPEDTPLYTGDWTDRCTGGTTITASEWTVIEPLGDTTLTLGSPSILPGSVTTQVQLIGGTAGKVYRVENKVTLSGSPAQILERSFYLRIREM